MNMLLQPDNLMVSDDMLLFFKVLVFVNGILLRTCVLSIYHVCMVINGYNLTGYEHHENLKFSSHKCAYLS